MLGVTIASLTAAVASPPIGMFVDRSGPRLLMVLAAAMTGGTLIALSQVHEVWLFLLLFGGVLGLARPVLQAVGAQTTVAKWFIRRRGRAVTFSTLGLPLSAVVIIPFTQWMVEGFGWRAAWSVLGAGVLMMLMLPAGLFMRGRPEDLGLRPDGDPAESVTGPVVPGPHPASRPQHQEFDWSPKEAFRTRAFWMLSIGFAIIGIVPTILNIHMFPHFTDQGIAPATAAAANGSYGFWVMGSRIFFWGFALERLPIRRALVIWAALLTTAISFMILVNNALLAFAAAACFGLAMGGSAPLGTLTWARYFGRNSLGTITGVANLVGIVNDVVGPIMPSLVYDFTGNYRGAFAATALACLLAIGIFALAGAPREQVAPRRTRR